MAKTYIRNSNQSDIISSLVRWEEVTCLFFAQHTPPLELGDDLEFVQHLCMVGEALKKNLVDSYAWSMLDDRLLDKLACILITRNTTL